MFLRGRSSSRIALAVAVMSFVAIPWFSSTGAAQTVGIRQVSASAQSLIPLHTRIRYTTMVVLPDDEEILDVICGDKDYWVISATHNIAHIKPAKEGAATNLDLVTSTGAIYSFLLDEKSGGTPDLKVFVNADPSQPHGKPKYYTAAQFDSVQAELVDARNAVDAAQRRTDEAVAKFKAQYPATLQFVYGAVKYEKPFFVRSMWTDGQFTYIQSDARELPALYELKDGQPALVNFQVEHGTYVVPKVLERGYLALGNARWTFAEQQGR
jgi:type IV secretory pathway VirB9-like protein